LDDCKHQWIEDPANRDQRFTRNFVRAQLIPLIKRRWPNVLESVSASAASLSQVNTLLSATLEKSLEEVMAPQAGRVFCALPPLKIEKLINRTLFEFCQLLRHWIHKARLHSPTEAQLKSLHIQLTKRQQDRATPKSVAGFSSCKLHWNGMNIVSYGEHLFLFRDCVIPDGSVMPFKLSHTRLDSGLEVRFQKTPAGGLSVKLLNQGNLNWRWRKGGEKVKLPGRQHRSSLKKLLQHNRIPEWERKYLPYLEENGEIVWIHGIGVTKNYVVPEGCADQLIPEFVLVRSTKNSI
jgi:tRNA(Ile)-lysidine synthase